jgi:PAS domain S-box-containing protein
MITQPEANILNALDDAACVFEKTPLRSDGLRDYRYIFVNTAFRQLFGTPDLAGLSVRDNFPNEPESWYDDYDDVLNTGIPKRFVRKAPSQHMLLEMYLTRLEDGSGKRLLNTMRDVTEENHTRDALRESEAGLRESEANIHNLILQAPVAMALLTGPDLVVEIINDSFIALWGKDSSVRGKSIMEALPEMQGQDYPNILRHVYQTGETYHGKEARVLLFREGRLEPGYFNFVNEPYHNAEGKITGVIVVANEVTEQVIANQALSQVLEKIRLAKEAAELGMFDYDIINDVLEWDSRCRELFGISNNKPITFEEDFLNGLHPHDRERLRALIKNSFNKSKTNGAYDAEYRAIGKNDGQERWIRAKGQVFFDEFDSPIRFIGSVLDVTETKKHQEEQQRIITQLQLSEARFRNLVENAPVGIAIYMGREAIVGVVNEAMLTIWGKDKSVIGLPLSKALPELISENQPYLQLLDEVFTTGKRYNGNAEKALLVHDGELKEGYFTYIFQPLWDAQNEIYAVMQIAIDVTDQVAARLQLERTEEMLRFSVEAAKAVSWSIDLDTRELTVPKEFFRTYDLPQNQQQTLETMSAQIPAESRQQALASIEKSLAEGSELQIEHPIQTADGIRWLRVFGKVNPATPLQRASFSALTLDITEQKQDEIRKNDFIGMVSHELKTPLTSLTAMVQLLKSKLNRHNDHFLGNVAGNAEKQVKRMTRMINGFLNVSRLDSGKILINKERFELLRLVEEVVGEIRLHNSKQTFEMRGGQPVWVEADKDKISSVISNLLSNAAKYSPKDTSVFITFEVDDKYVTLSVQDQGLGIKPEDQEKIFDRYYRVEDHRTHHIAGFGIGLYLSAEIIRLHGGHISVESTPGRGSTFHFSLPV